MTDRGERRAQKERNLDRWRRIVKQWGVPGSSKGDTAEKLAHKAAAHGKLCSCHMCGNRRSIEGPTIQERRHLPE